MTARYVIAKHMTGKQVYHIGVILWSNGLVFSRFFDEIPSFVVNKERYESSLEFWNRMITLDEVDFLSEGRSASRDSTEFLDALKTFKEKDYWLSGGGFLLSNITEDNVDDVLNKIFVKAVSKNGENDGSSTN